jgi:hypothetical protein
MQAAHKVLTEEHSQVLSRQVGVTSQRTSLRQQLLTMEEQYMQARSQVGCDMSTVLSSDGALCKQDKQDIWALFVL